MPNWCPERCAKFHVDRVINEEAISEKPRGGGVGSDPQAVASKGTWIRFLLNVHLTGVTGRRMVHFEMIRLVNEDVVLYPVF